LGNFQGLGDQTFSGNLPGIFEGTPQGIVLVCFYYYYYYYYY